MKGNVILVADGWFASSKTCCMCSFKKGSLELSERTFNCEHCGSALDRDLNAARNFEKQLYPKSASGIYACGQDG